MRRGMLMFSALLVLQGSVSAFGAELHLSPVRVTALATDDEGVTRHAVLFDLSAIPDGATIDEARLEWTVNGVPDNEACLFTAEEITGSWNSGEDVRVAEDFLADWEISPLAGC